MSSRKQRVDLLAYGYAKQTKNDQDVPMDIVEIIKSFYDEYFYWTIKGQQMKQFINANIADKLYSTSSFTIKGIEFDMRVSPNGHRQKFKDNCIVYLRAKYMPSNIEYIRLYCHISCETTKMQSKFMRKWTKTGDLDGWIACLLSQCQHLYHKSISIGWWKYCA